MSNINTSAFISYAHEDWSFVKRLSKALEDNDILTFGDWQFHSGDEFPKQIETSIAKADNFVFIAGVFSLSSGWCHQELKWARENGKRIFVVVRHQIGQEVEAELKKKWASPEWGIELLRDSPEHVNWCEEAERNYYTTFKRTVWIRMRKKDTPECRCEFHEENDELILDDENCESEECDKDPFDEGLATLIKDLPQDLVHVRKHNEFLNLARLWSQHPEQLLMGDTLDEYERWLTDGSEKNPPPLSIHTEFFLESRKAQNSQQRQRLILGILIAAFFALGTFIAMLNIQQQRDVAETNLQQAESLLQAYQALQALRSNETDIALEMALAAIEAEPPPAQAQQVLFESYFAPGVMKRLNSPSQLHDRAIQSADVLSNTTGDFAVITDSADVMILWNLTTDEPELRFPVQEEGAIRIVAFSDNGRYIASAGENIVFLWNRDSGEMETSLQLNTTGKVSALDFSPNEQTLAIGITDGSIQLWRLNQSQWTHSGDLSIHISEINDVAFNQTGDKLASASADATVGIWDLNTAALITRFAEHDGWVTSVAWLNDSLLLSGSDDNTLFVWDMQGIQNPRRLLGHRDAITDLDVAPDSSRAISASRDGTLIVWDLNQGSVLWHLQGASGGHEAPITRIRFDKTGETAFTISSDRRVVQWSVMERGLLSRIVPSHNRAVQGISIPFGQDYILTSAIGQVWLRQRTTGQVIQNFEVPGRVMQAAISNDGKYVLTGALDGTVRLWNSDRLSANRGREIRLMGNGEQSHDAIVTHVAFDATGERALSASDDHTVIVWDIQTGDAISLFDGHETEVVSAVFVPGTDHIVSVDISGNFIRWDINTRQPILRFTGHGDGTQIIYMTINPSGDILASAGTDQNIFLWDLNGRQYGSEMRNSSGIWELSFIDNTRLISSTFDGDLVLWDTTSQEMLYRYNTGTSAITSIASMKDENGPNTILIAGTSNGELSTWYVPDLDEVVASLRRNMNNTDSS